MNKGITKHSVLLEVTSVLSPGNLHHLKLQSRSGAGVENHHYLYEDSDPNAHLELVKQTAKETRKSGYEINP